MHSTNGFGGTTARTVWDRMEALNTGDGLGGTTARTVWDMMETLNTGIQGTEQ